MAEMTVEKDVFVRDGYNVRRRAFVAGQVVDQAQYDRVVNNETAPLRSVNVRSMEVKVLDDRPKADAKEAAVAGAPADTVDAPNLAEPTEVEEKAAAKKKGK